MSVEVLPDVQALDRLAGDVRYDVEVLVKMQHGEPGEFGGSCDDQVRYRGCPMLASIGEQGQDLDRPVLNGWVMYSTGIEDNGGWANPVRKSAQSGSISARSPSRRSQRVRPSSRRNGTSWLATINAPW